MKIVVSSEMYDLEKKAIEEGLTEIEMMRTAAKSIVNHIESNATIDSSKKFTILVGKGNNGGDAIIVGSILSKKYKVKFIEIIENSHDINHLIDLEKPNNSNIEIYKYEKNNLGKIKKIIDGKNFIIDGVLGIGINRKLSPEISKIFEYINSLDNYVFSIDVPSGINADDGYIDLNSIKANETLMLGFPKKGIMNSSNFDFIGRISVLDIGISNEVQGKLNFLDEKYIKNITIEKKEGNHKYDNGKLLIIAGSKNFIGANLLSNSSALRTGVGLVGNLLNEEIFKYVAGKINDVIYHSIDLNSKKNIEYVSEKINSYDAILLGPGIGNDIKFYEPVIQKGINKPIILDAEGISLLTKKNRTFLPETVIITPHIGEMSKLSKISKEDILKNRLESALSISKKFEVFTVLKGPCTIITSPDQKISFAPWINSGLAKAGSGDVLSGLIAGFVANKNLVDTMKSIELGVYIHGYSGELARSDKGSISMISSDLIQYIPKAMNCLF